MMPRATRWAYTLWRLYDFTPQNTGHITQHTHISSPSSSSSLSGTGLSFRCWVTAKGADAIYLLQAEKYNLFFHGHTRRRSSFVYAERGSSFSPLTPVKLTWLMATRGSMWAKNKKAFGGTVNTAPDYWITALSKLVTKEGRCVWHFSNCNR